MRHLIQIVDEGLTFIFKEDALASQLPRLIKEWRKGCLFLKHKEKSRKKMKKISDKNKLKPCGRCAAFKNFSFLILILSSRKATLRTVSSHGLNFGSEVRNIDCMVCL